MKAVLYWTLSVALVILASRTQPSENQRTDASSPRDTLIGAWRLVSLEVPEADGKLSRIADLKGMLLYTPDGHMSVQLMYPPSSSGLSNDYVKNGYEASFGSYDVNEEAHTVTHHVLGSITEGLVGKNLTRAYQISDGHLIIKSTSPDEHWSVTWEHY